jgi:hypothetical protein
LWFEVQDGLGEFRGLEASVRADGQNRIGFRNQSSSARYRRSLKGTLNELNPLVIPARVIGRFVLILLFDAFQIYLNDGAADAKRRIRCLDFIIFVLLHTGNEPICASASFKHDGSAAIIGIVHKFIKPNLGFRTDANLGLVDKNQLCNCSVTAADQFVGMDRISR